MSFGERLKKARENTPYGQGELGKLCGWRSAQTRVANYEKGTREPRLSDIEKMATQLGVPPEELAFASIGLTDEEIALIQAWRLGDADTKAVFRNLAKISRRPKHGKNRNSK